MKNIVMLVLMTLIIVGCESRNATGTVIGKNYFPEETYPTFNPNTSTSSIRVESEWWQLVIQQDECDDLKEFTESVTESVYNEAELGGSYEYKSFHICEN